MNNLLNLFYFNAENFVERGVSINHEVFDNCIKEKFVVTQRLVYDALHTSNSLAYLQFSNN